MAIIATAAMYVSIFDSFNVHTNVEEHVTLCSFPSSAPHSALLESGLYLRIRIPVSDNTIFLKNFQDKFTPKCVKRWKVLKGSLMRSCIQHFLWTSFLPFGRLDDLVVCLPHIVQTKLVTQFSE